MCASSNLAREAQLSVGVASDSPKTSRLVFLLSVDRGGWIGRPTGTMNGRKDGKHVVMTLVYIVGWACASSGLIFLNNHLLTEDGFHYPMTVCSMG